MKPAPFAYEGLERIFHERGRLAVCTCLVANPTACASPNCKKPAR
jgi:hypothetical protein